jgi:hypothetical protein
MIQKNRAILLIVILLLVGFCFTVETAQAANGTKTYPVTSSSKFGTFVKINDVINLKDGSQWQITGASSTSIYGGDTILVDWVNWALQYMKLLTPYLPHWLALYLITIWL